MQDSERGQAAARPRSRFPESAYQFIRDGLAHTVQTIHGDVPGAKGNRNAPDPTDESRHVSGQQLCIGLRDLAIERYGLLARDVLARWGVHRSDDFGAIVYSMIERGELRSGRADRFEDFCGVFDFDETFRAVVLT